MPLLSEQVISPGILLLTGQKTKVRLFPCTKNEVTQQLIETYNIMILPDPVYTQARVGEPWGAIYGTGSVTDDDGNIIVAANGRAKR